MTDVYQWRRTLHIPFIIILQILFIILFAIFVRYDPQEALGSLEDPPLVSRWATSTPKSVLPTPDVLSANPEPSPDPRDRIPDPRTTGKYDNTNEIYEKTTSKYDSAYEFEKNLIAAVKEIKEPKNPSSSKIHEKISSLHSTIMRFIKDNTNSDHESTQEHGIHQQAVALISHVYPCTSL